MFKYPFDTKNLFTLNFCFMESASKSIKNPYIDLIERNPRDIFSKGSDMRNRQMQAEVAGSEFQTDLALLDYQNEYNSATNVAARQRAAGLNPDLLGLQGSDSAGLSGLAGSMPVEPDTNPLDRAQFWLSNVQNVLQSAFQVTSNLQDLRSKSLDNDMKNLDYMTQLQDLKDNVSSELYLSNLLNPDLRDSEEDTSSILRVLSSPLSKRNKRKFNKLFPRIEAQSKANKRFSDYLSSALDAGHSQAINNAYSGGKSDFGDVSEISKTYQHIAEFQQKMEGFISESDMYESEYNRDYWQNMSGKDMSSYDKNLAKVSSDTATDEYEARKGDRQIDQFFSELVSGLRNDDSWYSNIALAILYGMKSGALKDFSSMYSNFRPRAKSSRGKSYRSR